MAMPPEAAGSGPQKKRGETTRTTHGRQTAAGARRRKPVHERDVFHLWMLAGRHYAGRWEMPAVKASHAKPTGLIPFTLAMSRDCREYNCYIHFHEDDYRFEKV